MTEQQAAFWDSIEVFDKEGLLPFVMLIGSWAEYIYQFYFKSDFMSNLKTRDVDFLFRNLNIPKRKIELSKALEEKGFVYREDYLTGVGKFSKENFLEIEFITRVLGKGERAYEKIPSIGVKAEGLRAVNILADYPLTFKCRGYDIVVPEPEAYVMQKLIINTTRNPEDKKEKDIQAIRQLLKHINKNRVHEIYSRLTKAQKQTVDTVSKAHFIDI